MSAIESGEILQKKITGGHETRVNEYPAMVGLVDVNRRIYCGGTIISNNYVLTAAHCVHNRDPSTLFVQVGEHDVSTGEISFNMDISENNSKSVPLMNSVSKLSCNFSNYIPDKGSWIYLTVLIHLITQCHNV